MTMPPTASPDLRSQLGNKIREARERLSWSQTRLAEAVGLGSPQIVSTIENGQRELKAWELFKIAKALHVSVEQLLNPNATPEPVPQWRARPESEFREHEARFFQRCERYALVESWCGITEPQQLRPLSFQQSMPSFLQVRRDAENVRNALQLGSRPACSLSKILQEEFGVKIFCDDLGPNGAGFSVKGSFGYGILLNAANAPWRRNFSLAHELFHLLTWDSLAPSDQCEKLADAFASSLLLPTETLLEMVSARLENGCIAIEKLVEIARDFDVSTEALLWRLVNLGRLEKEAVSGALQSDSFRSVDRAMRTWDVAPMLPERYVRLCFLAYRKGKLGLAKLAEFLEKSLVDLASEIGEIGTDLPDSADTELAVTGC